MQRNFLIGLVLLLSGILHAQDSQPPFFKDIQEFKRQDSLQSPPANAILFTGSSSFTLWKDVSNYFPGYTIINRGFGGSSLTDLLRYEEEVIFKYKPKQIVLYCGENDIAGADSVTGRMVFERFKQLYKDIRAQLGKVPIVYVSMKPSPSRWHMRARTMEGNRLIQQFLQKKKRRGTFVNVWDAMLGPDGQPMAHLFIADRLHMNAAGYAIWKKLIEPWLIK
jgi:lysophospholipase L1-like esterase